MQFEGHVRTLDCIYMNFTNSFVYKKLSVIILSFALCCSVVLLAFSVSILANYYGAE